MLKARKFKELVLLKTKSLRNFSISNIVMTANSRELGSWFHSSQSKSHELCVIHISSVSQRVFVETYNIYSILS